MWHVIVPVKAWAVAKTRLGLPAPGRIELAQAMVQDTLHAVRRCPSVESVTVVVGDRSQLGSAPLRSADQALPEPAGHTDVNAVLRWSVDRLGLADSAVAVVVGDLPSLRPTTLAEALAEASGAPAGSFVADRHGAGTTVVAASRGRALAPRLGVDSARLHRATGLAEIGGVDDSVRCDVDTLDDLATALELGVGPSTSTVALRLGGSLTRLRP